ncbi:tetratricopeptide repeat protein [Actinomadura graeca]|uniref:Tetratricopeptide repeat protein n=1 Tax=Actinomadura graeca TaxID=2750812 RepID=A0ABX8QN00_9ACTN|nr:tetratricopeptide repeat protein [Actinomadura graeca]QXJ20136.1 tetratricopeptide repeat protein [Actinomadura graeca]
MSSATNHVSQVQRALKDAPKSALGGAASELTNQAALVFYDAGNLTAAEQMGSLSLDYAVHGADREGQARAYDGLSRISLYRGDFSRAASYARQGLKVPDVSYSQRATLFMRLGRALALISHQEANARTALDDARTVTGLSPFTEAALIGDVGIGLGNLRRYREAGTLLGEAAECIGEWSPLFQAQYLGRQVQAALRGRNPELAANHMDKLARAVPFVESARVNTRVQEILATSTRWLAVSEIRNARDHLKSVGCR